MKKVYRFTIEVQSKMQICTPVNLKRYMHKQVCHGRQRSLGITHTQHLRLVFYPKKEITHTSRTESQTN